MTLTVIARPDPAAAREWDRLVELTPGTDVAQLSSWARVRREAGFSPLHLLAYQDDRLVGGALVLERLLPGIGKIGYVSNGPVVASGAVRQSVLDRLARELDTLARIRLRALFVQPPSEGDDISLGLEQRGFRLSDSQIAPAASIRIDLRREIEELRGGLSKSNRRRTRTWCQHGVTVRLGSAEDVPLVAELVARTAEHQQFEPLSVGYIQALHREMDPGRHLAVFIAELEGVPVAARICTMCGGVVKQRLSGMDRSERARKEGVAAATVWHAIQWAKVNGYEAYDLGGISVDAARTLLSGRPGSAAKLTGTDLFKSSFGGRAFLYPPPVELIPSPLLRLSYDLSRRTRLGDRLVKAAKRALRGGRKR